MTIHSYESLLPENDSVFICILGSFSPKDVKSGAADAIRDQGFECPPNLLTSAEGQVFSYIQFEMIIVGNTLYFAAPNYLGCSILLYSDSISALSYISSS